MRGAGGAAGEREAAHGIPGAGSSEPPRAVDPGIVDSLAQLAFLVHGTLGQVAAERGPSSAGRLTPPRPGCSRQTLVSAGSAARSAPSTVAAFSRLALLE
jgi:hypothetical protein